MRGLIHLVRHDDFEIPGGIGTWAASRGRPLRDIFFFREGDSAPPAPAEVDTLVIMGGTMSANDEATLPWIRREKLWVSEVVTSGAKVLGICLGCQILASILGGRVYRNAHREIGWFPVRRTEEARRTAIGSAIPEVHESFLWHSDTFDIPPGAVRVAASEASVNQGFVWRESVAGVQFHPEMTRDGAAVIVANSAHEIVPGPYVQEAETFLTGPERYAALERVMHAILDRLTEIG
jgi:GMP synthase-like glutamine amidotransferase